MVMKTTSFKLDSELLKLLKIRATEKEITQSELVTLYLKNCLKYDFSEDDFKLLKLFNMKSNNHMEKIKKNFVMPYELKYNPQKENKPISEEKTVFEDEGGIDIFSDVLGIVSSPTRTNSVELKKETYDRG